MPRLKQLTLGVALYSKQWIEVEVPDEVLGRYSVFPESAGITDELKLMEILGECGPADVGQDSVAKVWVHSWE